MVRYESSRFTVCKILVILGCCLQATDTSNILFFLPFGSISHVHTMTPLMEKLSSLGHNVTFLSIVAPRSPFKNKINMFHMKQLEEVFESLRPNSFDMMDYNISLMFGMLKMMSNEICTSLLTADQFRQIVLDKSTRYDVVIMDNLMSECGLGIVPLLGNPPLVYYCTTAIYDWTAWALDIPVPFSYVSSLFRPQEHHMTFAQRTANVFAHLRFLIYRKFVAFPNENRLVQKHWPGLPNVEDIERNVSLVLTNSHSASLDRVRPLAPFLIEVGGTHCRPAKKLTQDLEDFCKTSGKDGFIYFSLGTNVRSNEMPPEKLQAFLDAFGRLNQTVLWKFESKMNNLPANVKITEWAPQQDILGHPNIKLFITHGGQLSTQEAIYHGVPVLGLPLGWDQDLNMDAGVSKGFARRLHHNNITSEVIYENIIHIVYDKRYKEKAAYYSSLMRDRPEHPLDKATFWVEFAIRHQNHTLKYLRFNGANNLNIFQYFLLDVIAFFFTVLGILIFITFYIGRLILRIILRNKGNKRTHNKQKIN